MIDEFEPNGVLLPPWPRRALIFEYAIGFDIIPAISSLIESWMAADFMTSLKPLFTP